MENSDSRRSFLRLTAAGLIHVSARPFADGVYGAEMANNSDLLIRSAAERGHVDLGWLKSYHTFSFGNYIDEKHMGFRSLRVINDDKIMPGRGFPTHPHRNMEIISYLLDGAIQHRDSEGNGSIVRVGEVQRMTAGKGITHSEYNPDPDVWTHLLQIWIRPAMRGLQPSYQDHRFATAERNNRWSLIAAPDDKQASVHINQDAQLKATILEPGKTLEHVLERDRHVWLHVGRGELNVNGTNLSGGDAIATSRSMAMELAATTEAEVLLFDLG
ncbi:pirin family protein [Calycomorphotria hydatis]|uniref:Quercetin 2,3-dioxygenase n=1 Tax=Calycomorphotria hydatis TaxID=2528027 RepID=A0A517TAQ3_9PLAN|nr:pirin family protein [Calycomorphotria hydatis]QDT65454.1 Quercetin 2,3-dioxygenase [Calycomorphotria hydatis]